MRSYRDAKSVGHQARRRSDTGAVAITVALMVVALAVVAAMTLDFGAVRLDRQMNKSSADAAAAAGVRGLDTGNGKPHPFAGVCQALEYLKRSQPDMAGLPSSGGNVNCPASSADFNKECPSASAHYEATFGNVRVDIKSPYLVSDGDFPEEDMDALQGDTGDSTLAGCDQIAVIISELKEPGLGRLATDSDLGSRIRSVARLTIGEEGQGAVALLILEREACNAIAVNDNGAGVWVRGNENMPGMIHSDSIAKPGAADCTSRPALYSQTDYGIHAEESEKDPKLPGLISVRSLSGDPAADPANTSSAFPKVVAEPGGDPIGRGLVTRSPVDSRWLSGVRAAMLPAPAKWTTTWVDDGLNPGVTVVPATNCSGSGPGAGVEAQKGTVVFNCSEVKFTGPVTLQASQVIFKGKLWVADAFAMPKASEVYIRGYTGSGPAFGVKVDGKLRIHTDGRIDPTDGKCTEDNVSGRGKVVIGGGSFSATAANSLTQMCHSTLLMMGNNFSAATPGCLPLSNGTEPTTNTCDGFVEITGGNSDGNGQDWTAPDEVDEGPDQSDWDLLEDLALWTESEDTNSSTQHRIGGGGAMHLAGAFVLANANSFRLSGGSSQDMLNSQYVARRLEVRGGAVMEMKPDPHDAFKVSILGGFELVR